MNSKKLLITLVIIGSVLAYYFKNRESASFAINESNIVKKKRITKKSKHSSVKSVDSNIYNISKHESKSLDEQPIESLRGICHYIEMDKRNYIILNLAKHLYEKKPGFIILPAIHGECLKNTSGGEFNIVRYDDTRHVAYDYLGSIQFNLKFDQEFSLIQDFSNRPSIKLEEYGFGNAQEFAKYLSQMGYGKFSDKRLISFKVSGISNLVNKKSSVVYDVYPGVQLISFAAAVEKVNSQKANMINLSSGEESALAKIPGVKEKFQIINGQKIKSPTQVYKLVPEAEIKKIPKNKEVILIGQDDSDYRVFNIATLLTSYNYEKVSVVKGGFVEASGQAVETPKDIAGIRVINFESTVNNLKDFIVIDTRIEKFVNNFLIDSSYSVPCYFSEATSNRYKFIQKYYSGVKPFPPQYNPGLFLDLEKLKIIATKDKPILVIGSNEYDWNPVLVSEYLRSHLTSQIYWARDGIDMLESLDSLGILMKERAASIKNLNILEERIENTQQNTSDHKMVILTLSFKTNNELRLQYRRNQ